MSLARAGFMNQARPRPAAIAQPLSVIAAISTDTAHITANWKSAESVGSTNWGRKAVKKAAVFGLDTATRKPRETCTRCGGAIVSYNCGTNAFSKTAGRSFDLPNPDEVVQGTGIGDDEPHRRSESKAPKIIPIVIQVVDCKRNVDLVGLEERVQRLTRR
jgi:hypothetical protein